MKLKYVLTDRDCDAILAALPIALHAANNDAETMSYIEHVTSAGEKLIKREKQLTNAELRVICIAVISARECLAGKPGFELDTELRREIKKYFFEYQRLSQVFEEQFLNK